MTDYLEIAKRNIVHPNFHNGNTLSSEKIRFLHIWVEHIMRQDDPKRFQFYANEAMTVFAIDQKIVDYVEFLWQLKIDTSTTVNKIMSGPQIRTKDLPSSPHNSNDELPFGEIL